MFAHGYRCVLSTHIPGVCLASVDTSPSLHYPKYSQRYLIIICSSFGENLMVSSHNSPAEFGILSSRILAKQSLKWSYL